MWSLLYLSIEEKLLLSMENSMKKMSWQMFRGDHCTYIVSWGFYLWFTLEIIKWWLCHRYFTWSLIIRIFMEIAYRDYHRYLSWKSLLILSCCLPMKKTIMEILKIFHRDFSWRSAMKIFIKINYRDLS